MIRRARTAKRIWTAAATLLATLILVVWTSCSHDPDRVWPARWMARDVRTRVGQRFQAVVAPIHGPIEGWTGRRLSPGDADADPGRSALDDAALLFGRAIRGDEVRFEGTGSYVFDVTLGQGSAPSPPGASGRGTGASVLLRCISGERIAGDGRPAVRIDRTWLALYEPTRGEPRGVVLVIPGMFGTPAPIVDGLVLRLRQRGWGVLRMLSPSARFTEHTEIVVDGSAPEQAARSIASELTGRAADVAYAAEASMGWLDEHRPELRPRRAAMIGLSGGAMATPTVVARDPARYGVVVIVAGGANFYEISERSTYADFIDAVRVRWPDGPPSQAQRERLSSLYLRLAPLDAFNVAQGIRDRPILMIHGSRDGAVPADLGDVLWRRLGEPERWVRAVGHEALFLALPLRFDRMIDWIEAAMGDGAP